MFGSAGLLGERRGGREGGLDRPGTRATGRVIAPLLFAGVIGVVAGCGGSTKHDDSPFPGGIDCSACNGEHVCWYTSDETGKITRSGCLALPAECSGAATCACVNGAEERVCDQVGWEQNFNACTTVRDVAVVQCISTLG